MAKPTEPQFNLSVTQCCKHCGVTKPLTDFHKAKGNRLGAATFCNICAKPFYAARHKRNLAKIKAQKATYRGKNRAHANAKSKKWRDDNPERVKANNQRYYVANAATERAKKREKRALNLPDFLERERASYRKHAEKRKPAAAAYRKRTRPARAAYERSYNKTNAQRIAERKRRYKALRPLAFAAYSRNRKARVRNAPGSHTAMDIKFLMDVQRGKCAHSWCRVSLKDGHEVDHIIALSKGGSNDRKNLQLLCSPCNKEKTNKHPIDFAQQKGMLL